jgi:hypothetical protein
MKCPRCGTEMAKDHKKWLGAVIGLDERLFTLYYCPNKACTEHERLICRNKETDTPFKGPWTPDCVELVETTYA